MLPNLTTGKPHVSISWPTIGCSVSYISTAIGCLSYTHISYHDKIIPNLDWYLDPYCTCLTWLLQKFLLKIFDHFQHESNPADFAAGGSVGISDGANSTEKAAELCSACELSPRFEIYGTVIYKFISWDRSKYWQIRVPSPVLCPIQILSLDIQAQIQDKTAITFL